MKDPIELAADIAERRASLLDRLARHGRGETYEQLREEVDHMVHGFTSLVAAKDEQIADLQVTLDRRTRHFDEYRGFCEDPDSEFGEILPEELALVRATARVVELEDALREVRKVFSSDEALDNCPHDDPETCPWAECHAAVGVIRKALGEGGDRV